MSSNSTLLQVEYGHGDDVTVLIRGPEKFYPSVDKKKITTPMTQAQFEGVREAKVVNRILLIGESRVLRALLSLKKTSSNYVVTSEFSEMFENRTYVTQTNFFRSDESSVVLPSNDVSEIAAVSAVRNLQGSRIESSLTFMYVDGKLKCSRKITGTFEITQKVAFVYFDFICHARSGKFYLVDDHYELLDVSSYSDNSSSSPSIVISFYIDRETICGTYTASAVDMSTDGKSSSCICGSNSQLTYPPGTNPEEIQAALQKCVKDTMAPIVYVDPVDTSANSMWTNDYVPQIKDDGQSLEGTFGTLFYSDVPATIKGVRFYKSERNTGEHSCTLWDVDSKTLLASDDGVETASGRQVVYFADPVEIEANKRYCVAYHSNNGHLSLDDSFSPGTNNQNLFCLGSCFSYGPMSFPSQRLDENYYVDVVYEKDADAVPDPSAPGPSDPQVVAPFSLAKDFPIANQTATSLDTPTTFGNEFVLVTEAILDSVSFRSWSADTFPPKIRLYDAVTKALLFSSDTTIETPITGWKTVTIKSRVILEANKRYILAVFYYLYRPEYANVTSGIYTDYRVMQVGYISKSYSSTGDVCPSGVLSTTPGIVPVLSGVEEGQETYISDSMLGKSIYPDTYPIYATVLSGQSTQLTYGTVFTSNVAGSITALRYFRAVDSVGALMLALWDVQNQVILASVAAPSSSPAGWNTIQLPTPIAVDSAKQYLVAASYAAQAKITYLNVSVTTGISSLHLTPVTSRYSYSGYTTFPTYLQGASYLADVVFEAVP